MDLLFNRPPEIPKGLDNVLLYKLQSQKYFKELKSFIWIFIEIIATLLVLGIIWINIEWVKIVVSSIAIAIALLLLLVIIYIF